MTKYRRAMPALRWLAKKDPEAALAVLDEIRNSSHQVHHVEGPGYLNPRDHNRDDAETHDAPSEPLTSETLADLVQDGPDETWPEMLHEMKPNLHVMLRAAGGWATPWCGECWQNRRTGKVFWRGEPWAYVWTRLPHLSKRHVVTIGGLIFYTRPEARRGREGGMLRSYVDANGQEQRPSYATSKPRGGKRPHRTSAAVAAYLAMPVAIPSPLHADGYQRPMSGQPVLMPMLTPLHRRAPEKSFNICGQLDKEGRGGVEEGRAELVAFGVDGSVPSDALPFPATRCPTVIARGTRFIAGIVGAKQTASVPAPSWQVSEVRRLSPILEEVAARGDLSQIGEVVRDKSKPAPSRPDRQGGRALLTEARILLASNDNERRKIAA